MSNVEDDEESDGDDYERVVTNGIEVAWVDWDSGGPGAGAGRVTAYELDGRFYVAHDAGMSQYDTFEAAIEGGWIWATDVTTRLWVADQYKERHRALSRGSS